MNRATLIFRSIFIVPMVVLLIITALVFQEDCQTHAQDKLQSKIQIPFSASAHPDDLTSQKVMFSAYVTKDKAKFINKEKYEGVGGCHCVTNLEYIGTKPEFTKTKATGSLDYLIHEKGMCLSWQTSSRVVEVRVNATDGDLFARSPLTFNLLASWAVKGTKFYLQDVDGGKPLILENTIDIFVLE